MHLADRDPWPHGRPRPRRRHPGPAGRAGRPGRGRRQPVGDRRGRQRAARRQRRRHGRRHRGGEGRRAPRGRGDGRPGAALRRHPPDGRRGALRAGRRARRPVRGPALGGVLGRRRARARWPGSAPCWRSAAAVPVEMAAAAHDAAVALVSHVPQVAASLVAARLAEGEDAALALTGQGLRDVTRVAASDPDLWVDILAANAEPVARILTELRQDVDAVVTRCTRWPRTPSGPGPRCARCWCGATPAGPGCRASTAAAPRRTPWCPWSSPTAPGELARLVVDVGAAGVNIEDIRIEHSPGQPVGLVELAVAPGAETQVWPRPWLRSAGSCTPERVASGGSPPQIPCRGTACPRPATTPPTRPPGAVWWSPSTARPAPASPACPAR